MRNFKPEIEAQLRQQLAAAKFAETAEAFTNSVFEQPDSLEPRDYRGRHSAGWHGCVAQCQFSCAVYQMPLKKKRNTEAIELAPPPAGGRTGDSVHTCTA